ncbi:MAG: DUF4097 family beta strand repeat-containing protein, partial [Sphingopyxis sp.]
GNGGSGRGGTATLRVDGASGAVVVDGAQFAVNGFGSAAGHGMVNAAAAVPPINGYDGGIGGFGMGGLIEFETNDGTLTFSANNGGPALISRGTGGAGGNGADNPTGVGGYSNYGGVGSGGEITLRANGGTIVVAQNAPLSIITSGLGGLAGTSGTGGIIGTGGGYSGTTYDEAGRIRFEANDSAGSQGLIRFSDATLQANGDHAGRIELIDNSAGAGLSFNSLNAESIGFPLITADFTTQGSGIYVNSRDGAIRLGGGISYLRASGTIQVDAANTGGISATGAVGQINIAGGNVIARHTAPGANTPTIFAADRINVTSSLIDFQAGTLVSANAGMSLQSDSSINYDRLLSSNATGNSSIFVDAVTNIVGNSATSASTTSGNAIILNSRTGNVQFGKLDSNTQIIVDARNGSITGTRARSGGSMTMDAGGSITFDNLVSDTFLLELNAGTNVTGNGIVSGGSSTIIAGGNVQFGTFTAANALSIRAGGTITGTAATATLIGGPGMLLFGPGGVNVGSVNSGGETGLIANGGAVVVGNLRSSGLILAEGRSVTIAGSGGLKFTELNATAGDARVTATSGDLTVQSGTVSGTATLTTGSGDLTAQNLGANRVVLNSNRTARIAGTVTGTAGLDVTSTGATIVDGIATGGVITMTSGDIVIGSAGRIGTGGTTSAVTLINGDSGVRTYVGGNDQANAYSLSAAEMLRLFGTNVTIRAPRTVAQSNAALGSSRPPDVIIGAFTFNGATASNGNLGAGGTLSIITPGSARVIGAAQLTNMTSSNGFAITADQGIEVILGQGSIRLTGAGSGALAGVLTLKADDIAVATSNAISDIAAAPDIAAINTRLGRNDGITSADGALFAATINLDATNGLYIQNSGSSDRTNDRRGFTTNALNITSASTSTRIVINGQIANAAGVFQNGADTIRPTMINGVAAGPGGAFAQGSTINGCLIANAAGCNAVINFDQDGFLRNQISTNGRREPTIRRLLLLGLGRLAIHIRDVEPLRDEPLLDEPITGSGNDDLWVEDSDGE